MHMTCMHGHMGLGSSKILISKSLGKFVLNVYGQFGFVQDVLFDGPQARYNGPKSDFATLFRNHSLFNNIELMQV